MSATSCSEFAFYWPYWPIQYKGPFGKNFYEQKQICVEISGLNMYIHIFFQIEAKQFPKITVRHSAKKWSSNTAAQYTIRGAIWLSPIVQEQEEPNKKRSGFKFHSRGTACLGVTRHLSIWKKLNILMLKYLDVGARVRICIGSNKQVPLGILKQSWT